MRFQEGPKHLRMVIPRIIQNHHRLSPSLAMPKQTGEKLLEGDGIEGLFQLGHQSAIPQVDRPQKGHRLSGGRPPQDRIFVLRRDPHGSPGSMLLEMAFIEAPQVEVVPSGQPEAFF